MQSAWVNLRFGLTPDQDRLPCLLLKPLPDGHTEGRVPDISMMFGEYYKFREWDIISGAVSMQKLTDLGLDDIALKI
ncbi:MAG TPA: hypothetical protein ENI15_19755 [Spirochaetes bacterium]|nr:hypothetical protein [Spirochaetota bacterium]